MQRDKSLIARGTKENGMRKQACSFDDITHEEIRQLALAEGCSFASKVRDLVEWGLMAVKDKKDTNKCL